MLGVAITAVAFLAPTPALAFTKADVPPARDCSKVPDYVDEHIQVTDPHSGHEVPLSRINEDRICRYSFKATMDQDSRNRSNCWSLFYELREQVGTRTAPLGRGGAPTLRSLMIEACEATKKFDTCRSMPNGTAMQACVASAAAEVAAADRKQIAQTAKVHALTKKFQANLDQSAKRFRNLQGLLAKVTDPADQKKSTITVDGITVRAAQFGQPDIASVIVLVGGDASTPPQGTVHKSALPSENQAAFEVTRRAAGAAVALEVDARRRLAEYERVAAKAKVNVNRASGLTGLNKRNDPTLPSGPAAGAIQPPRAVSTSDPFPSNAALANAANAAGALGKGGGGASGGAGGQTSPLASQGYPAAKQEELVQGKSETAKPANELARETGSEKDKELLRELTATDDKKAPDTAESAKLSQTGQEIPAGQAGGGGRRGTPQIGGDAMAVAQVKATGGGVGGLGGTASGSRTGEKKDCKGDDCAKSGKEGATADGSAAGAGGGVPGFEGEGEKGDAKQKGEVAASAKGEAKQEKEAPLTKFEEVKDKSKDFAALDAIFNEVAGKAADAKKAAQGVMAGLAAAVGLGEPQGEADVVKAAEEPASEPGAPAPKKAERKIASGTEAYTDNFDGDLGLDMSLFQRVSECYRRRGLARSAQ